MEWSNIRMSKAEFERLQKEYMAAAIKTAEKAKTFEKSEETVTVNENTSKTDSGVTQSADIAVMTKTTETVSETKSEPKSEIMPEPEKTNSLPDTDPEEDVFLPEDETENITLTDTENGDEITATPIEETEDEKVEITQSEYTENVNFDKEESSSEEKKADNVQNDAEICDEHQKQTTLCNNDEETVSAEIADKCDNTAVSDECENQENHTVDEILCSFESTFMSEEEADRKAEKLSASNQKPRPAPDFNATIHNHNNNPGKSGKPCGCEHCRRSGSSRMQEKGGQKPN